MPEWGRDSGVFDGSRVSRMAKASGLAAAEGPRATAEAYPARADCKPELARLGTAPAQNRYCAVATTVRGSPMRIWPALVADA